MPRRVDQNQRAIVAALRQFGATVLHTHTLGHGAPDIIVGHRNRNLMLEIKAEGGHLTDDEHEFGRTWRGQYLVVHSVEEALGVLKGDSHDNAQPAN